MRMMSHQIQGIKRQKLYVKKKKSRNVGVEKHNNRNEKFTKET